MKNLDEKFMAQALQLARLGMRDVAPNPMVGAIIVRGNKVIAKGYHQKYGGPHAEITAIQSVKQKTELEGATMYITLEPCRHFGKTPPCLDFVRAMGVKKIICGSHDPFQKAISDQRSAISFLKGEIARECKKLNKFFFTWVEKKRPFVTVKIAMSADGFVAGPKGKPVRLTTAKQDSEVHRMRAAHQAIMVGINTVLTDDPRLTVRFDRGADPLRVILDSHLRVPKKAKVLKDKNYLIATCRAGGKGLNIWTSPTQKQVSLKKLFKHLASIGIASVLVEPGPTLYQSLKKQGLIDELVVYRSRTKIHQGLKMGL